MSRKFRRCLASVALGLGIAAQALPVASQDFPSKPMQIVIPVPPGGAMDWLTRAVGAELEKRWKRPVVVDNKAGAGGLIASQAVARAPADGHTLLLINSAVTGYPVFVKTDFDVERDLVPLASAMETPYVLFANAELPQRTLQAVAAYSKSAKLNIAMIPSSTQNLKSARVLQGAGIEAANVPYNGAGPVLRALLANEVQLYLGTPFGITEQVKAGKLVALAVAGSTKIADLPDAPTTRSLGINVEEGEWYAFFAPKGTPSAVTAKLSHEIVAIASLPEFMSQIKTRGYEPRTIGPEQMVKLVAEESRLARQTARALGIQPQ